MKRTLAIILSAVMLLTAFPLTVFAEGTCEEHKVKDWNYWKYSGPGDTADCTDSDYVIYRGGYCTECGGYMSEKIPTQPSHVLEALPMYDAEGKVIEENYKRPSCEEAGFLAYQCKICKKVVEDSVPATGHTYGEAEVYVRCFDPDGVSEYVDNSTNGLYRKYCINAGCNAYAEERITNHTVFKQDSKDPNCFTDGHTSFIYCVNCASESKIEIIPKLEHIDENNDQRCDLCFSNYLSEGVFCSCMCHSENSFIQFIMPLLTLIWRILGMDNCHGSCEAAHYEMTESF